MFKKVLCQKINNENGIRKIKVADICRRCAVSLKKDTPYLITLKLNQTFILENRYAAFELECAVPVRYQKSIIFIKIKCAVLAEANAPYFRYVSKYKIFDSVNAPYR